MMVRMISVVNQNVVSDGVRGWMRMRKSAFIKHLIDALPLSSTHAMLFDFYGGEISTTKMFVSHFCTGKKKVCFLT